MTELLSKTYNPKDVESEISRRWMDAGAFGADPEADGDPYCIVIPPPNVTAPLHLGHALNNTLQDVLVRWRRMQGRNTLWMPGTDHAGIATQTVVEKRILAEEGRRRTDFQRAEFVARVQAWKDEYEARIIEQLKLMGCSCDWRRTRFTMDEICARAVREAFFRLFADGLIYRGKRLVNWDPATQTVLADDEVQHETVHGTFWYMNYPLVEPVEVGGRRIEHVTVATTRPETMLGDTGVAINPNDPRAEALVGRRVRLPIVGRIIPIVPDEHVVPPDPDSEDEKARYSTGFLKVTPAHDPDDYEIGQRHGLAMINVLAPDATISERHGWADWERIRNPDVEALIGMDRFEAREAVVEWFRRENLLIDERPYTHEVGHSYRSNVPIEPYLSDQWYIAVKKPIERLGERFGTGNIEGTDVPKNSLAGLALKPLLDGELRFTPDRYAKTYQTWLENLRDWPISRQLWWGHQIPVYKLHLRIMAVEYGVREVDEVQEEFIDRFRKTFFDFAGKADSDNHFDVIWARDFPGAPRSWAYVCTLTSSADKAMDELRRATGHINPDGTRQKGAPQTDIEREMAEFVDSVDRDPDVLDTWFSSALWPFSTMGWPDDTPELKTYYPTDVLCTAREIITLWVSRMVMMGQYCRGDIPFPDVFIHAMIQDGEGRKMSKSLGNGIDPLDIIESHGADALRFTLAAMTTQTQDVRMPVESMTLPDGRVTNTSPKFDIGRNFCNKLWNAARFVMMNLERTPAWSEIDPTAELADRWILSRLNTAIAKATEALENFRFNELADTLYHFTWDEFCDWYVEAAKVRIQAGQDAPKAILAHGLDTILRLLHPIAPFITEAIWTRLNEAAPARGPQGRQAEPLLARAAWPVADNAAVSPAAERAFATLQELITQARNARKEHNVPPQQKVDAIIRPGGLAKGRIGGNVDLLASLAGLGNVEIREEDPAVPKDAAAVTTGDVRMYLLRIIDRDAELARLGKQAESLRSGIRGATAKLDNESFLHKAPPEVVDRERRRLEELQEKLASVEKSLEALSD